jgi:hypothetical protein
MNLIKPISLTSALFRLIVVAGLIIYSKAHAATRVEATVTVTNTVATGDLIQFNSQARLWTNNTLASTNWIITTNSAKATATNLFAYAVVNPWSNVVQVSYASPTSLLFYANFDVPLVGTVTGSWATISFRTNYIQTSGPVTMPYPTNITEAMRTNQMTALMESLRTNSQIAPLATGAFSNLVDRTSAQTIYGKTYTGTAVLTNAYLTNSVLASPKSTNAVNYGNAFSSPGTNTNSEQFGSLANASGAGALAVGYSSGAISNGSIAIGYSSAVSANHGIGIGTLADVSGFYGVAIGGTAHVTADYGVALGFGAHVTHANSISIGKSVSSVNTNEVRLGGSQDVVIGGLLFAEKGATNFALKGVTTNTALIKGGIYTNAVLQNPIATNIQSVGISSTSSNRIGGALVIVSSNLTSAVNGANNLSIAPNVAWLVVSGPTASWSISGIEGAAAISAGRVLWLKNDTSYILTLSHLSGLEATAGFRLSNPAGADGTLAAGMTVQLRHDGSYWQMISGVTATESVYWDDLRVPLSSTRIGATSPTIRTFMGNTRAWGFDAGTAQMMEFETQIPHGISTNYGIRPHLHWTLMDGAGGASNVVWGLEVTIANGGAVFPSTTTYYMTNTCGTNFFHTKGAFPELTGLKESAVVVGRLFRDAANASDNVAVEAFPLSLDWHVPKVRLGSVAEYGDY